MAKKKGGDFFEKMLKHAIMTAAIESTKDEHGRPNPYAVAGAAAGLGHGSVEDMIRLGGFLGAMGAFDDKPDTTDDDWWMHISDDGPEYGVSPYLYETKAEYLLAVRNAKKICLARKLRGWI